jgi:small subunit ribosomal protein S2
VAQLALKDLIQAGLHFGHAATSWNPKMAPFLFGIRKKVHIFDLKQTAKSLVAASHLAKEVSSRGKKVMFVGTKVQAQQAIREAAQATGSYYVCERWLGGMLTNHSVILRRLDRLSELEQIAQEGTKNYSKKILASFKREQKKLTRDLGGVRGMENLPDMVVVIDPNHEHTAVKEANICGIPVVGLTDSNCNPTPVDLVIPGNDDAKRGIKLVLDTLVASITEGQKEFEADGASEGTEAATEDVAEEPKSEEAEAPAEATQEASAEAKAEVQS